jgi:hypothetical protein
VKCRDWSERPADERYPILCREYLTPAGSITVSVEKPEDWPNGDHVPLIDDYLIPRSRRFLVGAH